MTMNKTDTSIEDFNAEPVYYCKQCLSLKIMNIPKMEVCFCDDCNSTDVGVCQIHEWERYYKNKYGLTFLNK